METDTSTKVAMPTAAERVRTMCTRAAPAQLMAGSGPTEACHVYQLLADGSFALTVSRGSSLATGNADPVILELLDHGRGPSGESVRALAWIRGRIHPAHPSQVGPLLDAMASRNPNPSLLDVGNGDSLLILDVASVIVADAAGAEVVDLSHLLDARPDPFCLIERTWVEHLQCHHQDMVERLRPRLPRGRRRGPLTLVGLDRYGLVVKTQGPEGDLEHRIPFFAPVSDQAGLSRALRSLTAPFGNGLQAGSRCRER